MFFDRWNPWAASPSEQLDLPQPHRYPQRHHAAPNHGSELPRRKRSFSNDCEHDDEDGAGGDDDIQPGPHPVHKAHKSTAHSHPSLHSAPRPNRTAKTKMKSWYSPQKRSPLPRQYEDRRDRHRNHDNDQYNGRGNGSDDDLGNGDRDLDTARTRPSGQSRPMPAQSSSESTSQDDPSESVQLTESPAELLVIRQITSLVYDNDQLFSAVQEYNSTVVSALSESRDDASDDLAAVFKRLNVEHIRASEFLMKTLLKIDDLACESGFERARTKRRDAVKFIQGLMERVDLLHQRALKGFERWAASEPPF